jgi:ribose transport system permease protein
MQLPRFLYAGPFLTLFLGFLFWGGYALSDAVLPERGIAEALQAMLPTVKASTDARMLWSLLFVGALIGCWGGISGFKKDAVASCGPVISLLVLFAVSAEINPVFLQVRNVMDVLRQTSCTGIVALGMTFVVASGGIDLSVGSLSAFLGGTMIGVLNLCAAAFGDGWVAVACALLTGVIMGALSGAVSGFIVTKLRVAPFVATLGMMMIYRSLTLYISNAGDFRSFSVFFSKIGAENGPFVPYSVWTFFILALLGTVLLGRTRYGRYVTAVGSSEKVAVYAAINVDKVRTFSYILVGAMTGVSAFLLTAGLNSVSSVNMGINFELDVLAAVIVGGTSMNGGSGTVTGTVAGALILGIVGNMLNTLGVSPHLQGMVKGLIIIAAVAVQRKKGKQRGDGDSGRLFGYRRGNDGDKGACGGRFRQGGRKFWASSFSFDALSRLGGARP